MRRSKVVAGPKSLVDFGRHLRVKSETVTNTISMHPRVEVEGGQISGLTTEGVHTFFGVPYAAAPIGKNRWKAPQPVEPWQGLRNATKFGARCFQTVGASFDARVTEESEDCLFLNIWTSTLDETAKQPVMVWIHGGGNLGGAGSEDASDGSHLAALGVTVVSFNYRLGAFGFVAHPTISANFAVLDHMAALGWVKRNIDKFGGDTEKVTLFGQSAGAQAVRVLLSCPSADGLFHRAILQSAGFEAPAFAEAWSYTRAHTAAEAMFTRLGSSDLDTLRNVPGEELKKISHELSGVIPTPGKVHTPANLVWMPVPDGELFTRTSPSEWPKSVPILMGYTANEARYFLKPGAPISREVLEKMAGVFCGPTRDGVLEAFDAQGCSPYEAVEELFSTAIWTEPAQATLQRLASAGREVFFYEFARSSPGAVASGELAKHTAEIRYVFGNLHEAGRYDEVDRDLSLALQQTWVSFARDGVPSGPDARAWPAYSAHSDLVTRIGDDVEVAPLHVSQVVKLIATLRTPSLESAG